VFLASSILVLAALILLQRIDVDTPVAEDEGPSAAHL